MILLSFKLLDTRQISIIWNLHDNQKRNESVQEFEADRSLTGLTDDILRPLSANGIRYLEMSQTVRISKLKIFTDAEVISLEFQAVESHTGPW